MSAAGDLLARAAALVGRARAYAVENRRRVAPVAMAVVLAVAAIALASAGLGSKYAPSAQIEVQESGRDAALAQRDADGDGLSDLQEVFTYGTDPKREDTDGDGAPDAWEARHRVYDPVSNAYAINPLLNDSGEDPDGDALPNVEEHACGTSPTEADTDGDGMGDAFECRFGLDNTADSGDEDPDGDGLTNLEESRHHTDPFSVDTDGDTLTDPEEVQAGDTDPARYSTAGHGISDGWLIHHGISPTEAGAAYLDPDGDGLTNLEEFQASRQRFNPAGRLDGGLEDYASWLSPTNDDTDGDGMGDGWEVRYALDPLDGSDAPLDYDGDGLTNRQEFAAGANPRAADTDHDGLTDHEEVVEGWEVTVEGEAIHVTSDPGRADTDGDFLTDLDERRGFTLGTGARVTFCPQGPCPLDPGSPDTDLDGLSDAFEVGYAVEPKLDPTREDSDGDGLTDKRELDHWTRLQQEATDDEVARLLIQGSLVACPGVGDVPSSEARAAMGPRGDADGDGTPNLVDADADCDGVSDGDEVHPPRREAAPGSKDTYPLPATSPALADTDGDDLPDPWESRYARWSYEVGDWNLNASNADSLRLDDGLNDGDRDLDGDGVDYSEGYARQREYVHSNREEFRAGTNPNRGDTDGDGITDGWEAFFSRVGVAEGVPVHLDPLDATDANGTSETLTYDRLAPVVDGEAPVDAGNESEVQRYANVPGPDGGERDVARIRGEYALTYLMEFEAATDPVLDDSDGDAMVDAWELRVLSITPDAVGQFNPANGEGALLDYDNDGVTNAAEARLGTDPVLDDSDWGGIVDGEEVTGEVSTDPLDPTDDDPNGDMDFDGLSNVRELRAGTSVADFDSDGDGLLDGSDRGASGLPPAAADLFRAAGVAAVTRGGGEAFLGEASQVPAADPTLWDSDGDGAPDGWEAYYSARHGTDPTVSRNDDDELSDAQEHALGLPDEWRVAADGVWWFGADPGVADSDGDGLNDGLIDQAAGLVLGSDYDYDNDGLNDFTGEDPFPFMDRDNDGAEDPRDPALVRDFVWGEGRRDTATVDASPQDGVADHRQAAAPRFTDVTITYSDGDKALKKGGGLRVEGRLVVDGGAPPAGVTVVANLWRGEGLQANGDAGRALGVAFTDGDGRFAMDVALVSERSVDAPAGAVLFGEAHDAAGDVAWQADTAAVTPGYDYRLVLWSYAVSPLEGRFDYQAEVDGKPVAAPGLESTFFAPYVHDDPLTVRSDGALQLPARLSAVNGEDVEVTARLTDAVGDPLAGQPLRATWRGETVARGTTNENGTAILEFNVGDWSAPGPRQLKVSFDGTDLITRAEATTDLYVVFPTALSAEVADPELTAVAGRTITVRGHLTDATGSPVPDGEVYVELQGQRFTDATDAGGAYRVRVEVPRDAVVGNRPLVAKFAGDERYAASRAEAGIVTVKQVARMAFQPAHGALGSPVEVRGELRDLSGATVRDPTVSQGLTVELRVGGHRLTVPVDNRTGAFAATLPRDAVDAAGAVDVRGVFYGSPLYEASESTLTATVTTATEIVLPAAKVTRGTAAVVEGRLLNAVGDPVPGAAVTVAFSGTRLGEATTDESGAFRAPLTVPATHPLGTVRVTAEFAGGDAGHLLPAEPAVALYQVRSATNLTLAGRAVATGDIPVSGALLDDGGRPIVGAPVEVAFAGATQTAHTDFAGRFEAVFNGHDLAPRDYTATAHYGGSNRFAPATASEAMPVLSDTALTVASMDVPVRGKGFTVQGALATGHGHPVAGALVTATLNDTEVATGRTDQTGRFILEGAIPLNVTQGVHGLRVAYGGDAHHAPSAHLTQVEVRAEPRMQLIVPDRLRVGDEFLGRVLLLDDRGRPIPDATVRVKFTGYNYPFTLTTNDTGVATFPGRVVTAGTAEVDVRFTGNSALLPQSQGSSIVASGGALSGADALPWLAALAALGLLAAAVAGYRRWRRGAVAEARRIFQDAETQLAAGNEYAAVVLHTYRALVDLVQRYEGLEDRPDLTAAEFATAIRGALPVSAARLDELVRVFEQARYSHHHIGSAERDRAVASFRAIQQELGGGGRRSGAPGGEPA